LDQSNHEQLARLLTTGLMRLGDVSPQAIEGYLGSLRQLAPDQRLRAAAGHSRMAFSAFCASLPSAAPNVPTSESLRVLARARYGSLPPAIEQLEPDYLPSIDEYDIARIASPVGLALEAAGVRWCLSGSLACCAFGEPRPIEELEFLVEVEEPMVPALVKHLGESFWASPALLASAARSHSTVSLFQLPFLLRVLLVDARAGELAATALARRVRVEGSCCGRMWLCSPEDAVLRALVAWRDAEDHEEIFWRDLAMILAVQGASLDPVHLDAQARRLEISETLEEARAQAGRG